MYDLSSKFNTFYTTRVVLPQEKLNELHAKKDLNVKRLKAGLEEYNTEHHTNYKVVETCVQGSVAMATVIQSEENDFDIDVAVVFDKNTLGSKGARAVRNIVADALSRKTTQFNAEPDVKTSCVRIKYKNDYHIDFAVYRRSWDDNNCCWEYEHAGSDWQKRDLKGLTEWFNDLNNLYDRKLRKIIRLSKMFCKSRDSWVNMPSGLLQTVLCAEKLQNSYDRIDELFYYTMKAIIERLEYESSVVAPVDDGRDLTPRDIDIQKMINWKNRLKSKIEDLEVLFSDECTKEDAIQAWYGFFNHDYWKEINEESSSFTTISSERYSVKPFNETEQFIEDIFDVNEVGTLELSCNISGDGFRTKPMKEFLSLLRKYIPHNFTITCSVKTTTVSSPYDVYWKVKNVGPMAERKNMLRGQIEKRGSIIIENTQFYGNHYIECYIVKDGICLAKKRLDVPIGR